MVRPLSTRNRGMWKTDSLPIQSIEPRSGRAVDLRTLPIKETGVSPVTEEGTYNMYCNREPRFYVSVIYNGAWLGVDNRRVNFLQRRP